MQAHWQSVHEASEGKKKRTRSQYHGKLRHSSNYSLNFADLFSEPKNEHSTDESHTLDTDAVTENKPEEIQSADDITTDQHNVVYAVVRSAAYATPFGMESIGNRAQRRARANITGHRNADTDRGMTSSDREQAYRQQCFKDYQAPQLTMPTLIPVLITMMKVRQT